MAVNLIDIALTFLTILSTFASLSMLFYLPRTERRAPHILQTQLKDKDRSRSSVNAALVSIIIPARNEEEKIRHCISSLLSQSYRNFELIVVDDGSKDDTPAIVREFASKDPRIQVIQSEQKPAGWVGKSWPCHVGFQSSKGDLVLFVDADSTFDSHVVEYCINHFEKESLDMFSISPNVVMQGVWSKSTLPLVSAGINLLYPMFKVNEKENKRAYVFGTFILVRKKVYDSIGGHEAVRDRIVEDAALAQNAKSKGYKLQVMIGDGLLSTDWESEFDSVYQGMERVFSDSIRSYGLVSFANAVIVFFIGLYPLLFAIGFGLYAVFVPNVLLGSGLDFMLLNVGFFVSIAGVLSSLSISANELKLLLGRRQKVGLTPLLFPLGYLLFISAVITSTLKVSQKKGLQWKGQKFNQELIIKNEKLS